MYMVLANPTCAVCRNAPFSVSAGVYAKCHVCTEALLMTYESGHYNGLAFCWRVFSFCLSLLVIKSVYHCMVLVI